MPHDMTATMKRAAGQIRKVRRNSNKGDKDAGHDVNINIEEHIQIPQQQPVRRKPTPEEAQLTAKNYRLAKELVREHWFCSVTTFCFLFMDTVLSQYCLVFHWNNI